jgi:branched-subunit amino acid transport protein
MTGIWITIAALALITAAYKLAGPILLGGRPMPARLAGAVELFASALLAALVVVETFGHGKALTVDARAGGLLAAGLLLWRRAPMLIVVVGAAATAAGIRAV